ncbi:MAG: hypothetical protein ACQEWG_04670 [Bacteroidota bacterium]
MIKNYLPLLFISTILLLPINSKAQEDEKLSVTISGHIWAESIFDTRQTVTARDGDVLLYPEKELLDANGKDINAKANFNMLNIHSRARLIITAPRFLNAKVTGLLEGDFVGSADDKIGLFRLRHAIVKLNWAKTELMAGQFWHPMFTLDVYPQIVSWGGALPYFPLERSAQLRYSYGATENSKFSIAASTELDFKSNGPNGPSTEYIRNSALPEFNATYIWGLKSKFLLGANVGYKTLKPQLSYQVGDLTFKSEESIGSYHVSLFSKIDIDKAAIRVGTIYGQNLFSFVMLGGYGVSGMNSQGEPEYTNFTVGSFWFDYDTGFIGEKTTLGIFAGYTKNYGADNTISGPVYARGTDIDFSYRISPRIIYGNGLVRFRAEVSYDNTSYGTPDANYDVKNTTNVGNVRFLFATTLHF